MEPSHLFWALRRHAVLVGFVFVVIAAGTAWAAVTPENRYSAKSTISVEPTEVGGTGASVQQITFLMPALQEDLTSDRLRATVDEGLVSGLPNAAYSVSSSVDSGTGVLRVIVDSGSREVVAPVANGYAAALASEVSTKRGLQGRVVDEASTPSSPSGPARAGTWLSGLVLACLVAIGVASVAAARDRRRDPSVVLGTYGVPLLGEIPSVRKLRTSALPDLVARVDEPGAEPIVALRTSLAILVSQRHYDTLAVAARRNGEGASAVAAGVAWSMARAGHRIRLIDADLRTPARDAPRTAPAGDLNDVPQVVTAQDVRLAGEAAWPGGGAPNGLHPVDLIGSGLPAVLQGVGRTAVELTIVDSPALLSGVESRLVLAVSHQVIVVVDVRRRHAASDLAATITELRDSGCSIVGVVYTNSRTARARRGRGVPDVSTAPYSMATNPKILPGRSTAEIDR